MDFRCNCFGVATAARVPVKRYNLLVPDVFPVVEPPFDRPLGITIERKIKKLAEYLDKNEHRAPKVSRRLQRRLYKELSAGHFGYVKLAVAAYDSLLKSSRPEKSNLLANELVVRTVVKRRRLPFGGKQYLAFKEAHLGSVVGVLLSHELPQLRKLGVDLLIDFIKCQHTSDYVPQLEAFVPLLCANAKPHAPASPSGTPASPGGTRRARSNSSALAVAAAEAAQWDALRAACLRALLEHLRFCARLSYVSYHLHTITFAVLECVEASGFGGALQGRYMSPRAALEAGRSPLESQDSISRGSISHAVAASPPDVAALLVFEELAHMTRDAAEGKKVLEFVMRFLDARGRWLGGGGLVGTAVSVLQQACEQEHQRYLLFSSLLRHVAVAEQLAPAERAAVLDLAVAEGGQLEAGLAAPALLLALRELPAVIASHAGAGEEVPPMPATPATPTKLAPAAAAAGAADGAQPAGGAAVGSSGGAPASLQQVELPKLAVNGARAQAAAAPVDLQPRVLGAVQQLAARVEDSVQLLEAVGSTVSRLRGAAPISTAALQCCVAAAGALQHLAPRTSRGAGLPRSATLSSLLLQELAGIGVSWGPQQRLLAHQLLLQLLPMAADGLKEHQAALLLSAVWHGAALGSNGPAAFVAMDCLLRTLLGSAPAAALLQAVRMLAALQLELLQADAGSAAGAATPAADGLVATVGADGSRLAALSPAQGCALLCMCGSALSALAAQLGQPALQRLAVPDSCGALQCLACAPPHGLLLPGLDGAAGQAAGSPEAVAEQQQFWQGPAVSLAFTAAEQAAAAAFLAQLRAGATLAAQQAALAAALEAVPLLKQQLGSSNSSFRPVPLANMMPRLLAQGGGFSGAFSSNGSRGSGAEAEGGSKRAQRLRSVYRHMRQISLCDSDRAMLATISQESAAEEPAAAALQLRGLGVPGLEGEGGDADGGGDEAGGPQSVDDVLAEVDAALQAAEEALEAGRSPSAQGWPSMGRASSGSVNGGVGGNGSPAAASSGSLQSALKPTRLHLSALR